MNRTVSWSTDAGTDAGAQAVASADAAQRSTSSGRHPDHTEEMRAIARQLERLSGTVSRREEGDGPPAGPGRLDALREAVAVIARRQAALDADIDAEGMGALASDLPPVRQPVPQPTPRSALSPMPPKAVDEPPTAAGRVDPSAATLAAPDRQAAVPPSFALPMPSVNRGASGLRRAGIDLSSEVSETFARFSRDLHDAVRATDARPKVEALGQHLGHQMRQIGRSLDGLGARAADAASADALARIGEQTSEMRDLLKASTARSVPFDGVERQVASLEARLGRLASSTPPAAAVPGFGETMAEVRALLDGFNPGATMAALETRLDAITDRIERGLDARGPSGLIEGLSRRVDEIHASLRSQLAEAAVDTRPLEGLVRGLSERIGQARDASADFHHLEAAVRDVGAKIDGAAVGLDPRGVQAVETQLARLGERLDRSEANLRGLDGVEQTLGELFSQFEVTRQVAIDAAETAARTAARDTLRAALQNPSLAHRGQDASTTAVDQMARSLDDIRALQDTAERRTQAALADIQIAVDRLIGQVAGAGSAGPAGLVGRSAAALADHPSAGLDPSDQIIEPGLGRGPAGPIGGGDLRTDPRSEPRSAFEAEAPTLPPNGEGDGPATFIAAARRAAQAAQASAAATKAATRAAAQAGDRGGPRRPKASRVRAPSAAIVSGRGSAALGRARSFLAQRRRPILLGLAALVLLVGALEVVKLSADPFAATRAEASRADVPPRARLASTAPPAGDSARPTDPSRTAELTKPVLPAAAAAFAPLPTFVTGGARAPGPTDGLPEGLRTAAAAGDAAAQCEVGLRYSEGRGVARDPKQAVAWFSKAAASGSAPAEYRLGSAYEKGAGVDRDPVLAVSWYAKAADAGNIRAMHNLAVMSADGAGGKPDYARAAQWFGKASIYGVRDSQFNLAILYARGLGIEQSLPQSYTWFAIAAAEGDEDAGKKRDEVATKLDAKALAAGKAAAEAFHPAVASAAANDAAPPPGGWDAAPSRPSAGNAKVSQL